MHGHDMMFDTDSARRLALSCRDPTADEHFVYAVLTTGIFCRPSCAARPARPENLRFFATASAAQADGYRACKRCRPDEPPKLQRDAAVIGRACRAIERAEAPPTLDELAAEAGMSPFHFHRLFRRIAGVTPRAYAAAHRADRARASLAVDGTVTDALYAAGFGSSGRFYAAAPALLGMTPSAYRARGAGESIRFAIGASSLGQVLVGVTDKGICAILLGDDPASLEADLRDRFARADIAPAPDAVADLLTRVVALVDDPRRGHDLPLDIRGTAFQRQVWEALQSILPGETLSYGALAARLGAPRAVRAVAGACAANAVAVAIPCHRVIGATGAPTGYRWGLARKQALLASERPAKE